MSKKGVVALISPLLQKDTITTSPVSAAPCFPKSLASSSFKTSKQNRFLSGLLERWVASRPLTDVPVLFTSFGIKESWIFFGKVS